LLLTADPVAQVGVDKSLQQLGVELVVVDQGGEAVAQGIPDMPDEGTVLEQLAVPGEKLLPQPGLQCLARVIGALQQRGQDVVGLPSREEKSRSNKSELVNRYPGILTPCARQGRERRPKSD